MTRHGLPHAPVENKVANGTITGFVTLFLSWVIVNFVPGIKHAPIDVKTSIPGFVSVLAGFGVAYMSKHEPRLDEVLTVVLEHMGQLGLETNVAGGQHTAALQVVDPYTETGPLEPEPVTAPEAAVTQQTVISASDLGAADLPQESEPAGPAVPDEYSSLWT